ncbi:type II secretion system F family protein [Thiomicrorhabdus xiamenensis]|nr:type II secretion system F family protein [Thiomicrorhabdus xiamenensis]
MALSIGITLAFITVLMLVMFFSLAQVFREKHRLQEKKDRFRKRVGLGIDFTQNFGAPYDCWWCRIGRALGSKNPKQLQILQTQLVGAGFREEWHIGAYFFIKFMLIFLAFFLGFVSWVFNGTSPLLMIALPLVTMFIPERVLVRQGEKRLEKINNQLPDYIDMITICMNAGLSYLVAIRRVTKELQNLSPEICFEFEYLVEQIQIGVPRVEALEQFAYRNPTRDIQNLVQVLVQNEKLGSSISEALTNFSRSMYQDRENLMEEKAAKTSAKMAIVILPFMLFPYVVLLLGEKLVMLGRGF